MQIVDLFPTKGTFIPGEPVQLVVKIQSESDKDGFLYIAARYLTDIVSEKKNPVKVHQGSCRLPIEIVVPADHPRGYGVEVSLLDAAGKVVSMASSSFDVLSDWIAFPRYGFLFDFSPGREDIESTFDTLTRFHINGLQFYDWQYRHDCLLAPTNEYTDPLGRNLSLEMVKNLIAGAHAHRIAAMPYLAVYAASMDFWKAHPEWALYDQQGKALTFEGILGLMNPAPDSGWMHHLMAECDSVLSALHFDGLHVDQYGNPKIGSDAKGEPVDLPAAFAVFIGALKDTHPDAAVVFNAVANWPIEALTNTAQDFAYIEVWQSTPFYRDLEHIILGARRASGGKPVVIALYQSADWAANIRLADAIIFSAGGSRIEIGEDGHLLTDPYFPKSTSLPSELKTVLHRYYDFAIRYENLIGPFAASIPDINTNVPRGVSVVARNCPGWLTLSLVNMSGLQELRWDKAHPEPRALTNLTVELDASEPLKSVWWASPDRGDLRLMPASWRIESGKTRVDIPYLDYWDLVAFELSEAE